VGETGGLVFLHSGNWRRCGEWPHVLKNANSFALLDEFGRIQAFGPAAGGRFFGDARDLSRLATAINAARPVLSPPVAEGNTALWVDFSTERRGAARSLGFVSQGSM
jgi:N-terminal domain of (some) glycogen debranching enzymes